MANTHPLSPLPAGTRYTGVVIDIAPTDGDPIFSVGLLCEDGILKAVTATEDETAARRVWTLLAHTMGCPRMIADGRGGIHAVECLSGLLVMRRPISRRPRRAVRRRPASRRRSPVQRPMPVYAGEREIIGYE